MAIRVRRGLKADFDPSKLLSGEPASLLDTRELYIAFAPGDVQKMVTYENMQQLMDQSMDDVKQDFTADIEQAISESEAATANAVEKAVYAQEKGDYADEAGDRANTAAANAESIVLGDIASETTVGVVRGGGEIKVSLSTGNMTAPSKLDKTGDSKDNTTTFTQASTLSNINSGDTHSTIFGKIAKLFSFIGITALTTTAQTISAAINELVSSKINKSDITGQSTTNDANKVPSSQVTYAQGQAITEMQEIVNDLNKYQDITSLLTNGWTAYPGTSLYFYRTGNSCRINGIIKSPSTLAPNIVLTLPIPASHVGFTTITPMLDATTNSVYLFNTGGALDYQGSPAKASTYYVIDTDYYM